MNGRGFSRRGFLGGAGALGAAALLAACSDGDGDSGKGGSSTAAKDAENGKDSASGFPVTVPGKEGSATMKAPAKRVAACGYLRDTDLALALGAPLVLIAKNAVFPSGLAPWQKPTGKPTLIDTVKGMPVEKVAAARPDLILASDDYQLADDYPKLSKFAPTLSYKAGVGQDGWEVMTQRAGDILGKRDKADELVKQVKAKIADVKKKHPEFEGRTATFGPVVGNQVFTTSRPDDASARFFSQLGIKLSPKVTALPESATPGRSEVSPERLDLLDADITILTFQSDGERKQFEAKPLFKKLKSVQRGSYIALDMPTAISLGFPSVLSIPYGLDAITPKLEKAVGAIG
ncbi:iron-siderophore ABC transporter substrate-binding protein [Streptomyces sp. NPDC050560]|uniref:iron-siderophore ABC transporter substrate-binding protein n=1 Tax=Streptomyces sp. NPDC050560 TaxID=3365630 RepID=UPI0037962210